MRAMTRTAGAVALLSAGAGCRGRAQESVEATGGWAVLVREGEAIHRFMNGEGWFDLSLVLATALLLSLLARLTVGAIRWLGLDDGRRLVPIRVLGDVLAVAVGGTMVVGFFAQVAPNITLLALLAAVLRLVIASGARLRGIGRVVSLVARGGVRQGDELRLGPLHGRIERIGLLQIRLALPDGARAFLSTRRLVGADVVVAPGRRAETLLVNADLNRAWTGADRRALEDIAAICPYRDLAEVALVEPSGERQLTLHVRPWSHAASDLAEAWLRREIAAFLSGAPPPPSE